MQLRRSRVQKCKGEMRRSKGDRKPDDWLGNFLEGRRTRGPEGQTELAPGFRRLRAEGLIPERLTTVAVT